MKTKKNILGLSVFILAVILIVFSSLWRSLNFDFWRDDWTNAWDLTFHPETSIYFDNSVTLTRHPGLAVEKVVGNYFLGQDVFDWQVLGICIRVLDSLAVALMVYGLTKSRKAGILAGLFMASTIGGLESVTWISAHTSALLIFFLSIGIYFWAKSLDSPSKHYGAFLLALFFISCAPLVTPAAGLFILPIVILWDILSWLRVRNRKFFLRIIPRIGIVSITVLGIVSLFNSVLKIFSGNDIINAVKLTLSNISLIKNYFSSLGNLLTSWFHPTNEPISLSVPTTFSQNATFIFILLSFLIVIFFLKKKSRNLQIAAFFSAWMFLFYLPNWMYEKTLVVGSSHRYLAVATIGLVSLVAVFVYKLKPKLVVLLSTIFIVLNIIAANKVLESLSVYRSSKIVEPIWNQIDSQVVPGRKDMIFMYQGSDLVWGTSMNWSGSVPFGMRRGISNADDLPIMTGDRQLIEKLLCEKNVYRPTLGGWIYQKDRIPISHLYAWLWTGKNLIDISQKERDLFIKEVPCRVLP